MVLALEPGTLREWRHLGACWNHEDALIFTHGRSRKARDICASCPVLADCWEYGMNHPELVGMYGGLTQQDRRHALGAPRTTSVSESLAGDLKKIKEMT